MKQKITGALLLIFLIVFQLNAEEYTVISPDGKLKIKLNVENGITYEVFHNNLSLIQSSDIAMSFDNGIITGKNEVKEVQEESVSNEIDVFIGKNKTLEDKYNELKIDFEKDYSLIVRAYDEGIAWRFQTAFEGTVIVNSETADFNFSANPSIVFPETNVDYASEEKGGYWLSMTNFERPYDTYQTIADIDLNTDIKPVDDQTRYANIPLMAIYPEDYTSGTPYKVVISESDLWDYPGLYLFRPADKTNTLSGYWPQYPKEVYSPDNMYNGHDVLSRYDYLAVTKGTRDYPWRIINVSSHDKDLLNNELVYKLSTPLLLEDISWIKPGKTVWEWWHKAMLTSTGAADPENGIPANGNANLGSTLYKYYVDWAAQNNISYITIDAGWGYTSSQMFLLCSYARTKNVGVWIWTFVNNVIETKDWIKKMKSYGVSGIKVDFINRDDQIAIGWMEQIARESAENKMQVLFHGCPKPTGMHRAYPNVLNYEAICGNESNFWNRNASPDYHLEATFIRMLAGPIDYTPGSLRNKTKNQFSPMDIENTVPSSMGTRPHELAMYVIFDQPLGFLCDAPTEYEKYPEALTFLQKVPTVWDKTVPLDAEYGKYAIMAKQTGDDWFVGGMSNWDGRTVKVDFSFLPEGYTYQADIIRDYNNGYPTRYVAETTTISHNSQLDIRMSQGGGFVIRLHDAKGTGIKNTQLKSGVSSYLDTSNHLLVIRSEQPLLSAEVYNISGQLVKSEMFGNESICYNQINLSGLNKGAYILKVKTSDTSSTSKFVY